MGVHGPSLFWKPGRQNLGAVRIGYGWYVTSFPGSSTFRATAPKLEYGGENPPWGANILGWCNAARFSLRGVDLVRYQDREPSF